MVGGLATEIMMVSDLGEAVMKLSFWERHLGQRWEKERPGVGGEGVA